MASQILIPATVTSNGGEHFFNNHGPFETFQREFVPPPNIEPTFAWLDPNQLVPNADSFGNTPWFSWASLCTNTMVRYAGLCAVHSKVQGIVHMDENANGIFAMGELTYACPFPSDVSL